MKYLVSQGADIRVRYDSAVRWASENGHLETVKYLVSQGADVQAKTTMPCNMRAAKVIWKRLNIWFPGADIRPGGKFAVRRASGNGHLETVKYLVSLGANVRDIRLCREWASEEGHLETVKYLVSMGANVRANDDYAVQWASGNGHLETVKYLVSQGANVRDIDDYAVGWASDNGHLETVKYLVSLGANVRAANDDAVE